MGDAKRLLKLLQGLEAALAAAEGPGHLAAVQSRLEAAEVGGMPGDHPLLLRAQAAVGYLKVADARRGLAAALGLAAQPRQQRCAPRKLRPGYLCPKPMSYAVP